MVHAGGHGDVDRRPVLLGQGRQDRGRVEDHGPVRAHPPAGHDDGRRPLPLDDRHPQDGLVDRHRRPRLQHVEERLGPQRQLAFRAQCLLCTSRTGCPTRSATPVATRPTRTWAPSVSRQTGRWEWIRAVRKHVLHVAESDVGQVEPEKVDALRGQAAQHRRPQRCRAQGDDELCRPFLRHLPTPPRLTVTYVIHR